MRNLIVGAGLSGLVLAERLANDRGEEVLLIDRRDHIGGNCADKDWGGILVHSYGAHIFHTKSPKVWEYITRFSLFYPYMHKVFGLVQGQLIPIPFNLNALYALFPHALAKELESTLLRTFGFGSRVSILELRKHKELEMIAEFIYENIFYHYTLKQWQCRPEELDPSVFARVPIIIAKDDRYFPADPYQGIPLEGYSAAFAKMITSRPEELDPSVFARVPIIIAKDDRYFPADPYQGIPLEGYSAAFAKMITSKRIEVRLGVEFSELESMGIDVGAFDRVFYSGAIDEYFSYKFGELPYRSLELKTLRLEREYFGSNSVINYPKNYDFTRIIEHKYFLDTKSPHTIITYEYPKKWQLGDERYYPMPTEQAKRAYEAYANEAKSLKNVFFIGRLGAYQYYDMDKAIEEALRLYESL